MKFYEGWSLAVSFGALITLTGFVAGDIFFREFMFCLNEPRLWIAIPEVIMGLSAVPYYINKIRGKNE